MFSILHFSPSIKTKKKSVYLISLSVERSPVRWTKLLFQRKVTHLLTLLCAHQGWEGCRRVLGNLLGLGVWGSPGCASQGPWATSQTHSSKRNWASLALCSFAPQHSSHTALIPFRSFLHRVILAVGNKPQPAACHTMSRMKEQMLGAQRKSSSSSWAPSPSAINLASGASVPGGCQSPPREPEVLSGLLCLFNVGYGHWQPCGVCE